MLWTTGLKDKHNNIKITNSQKLPVRTLIRIGELSYLPGHLTNVALQVALNQMYAAAQNQSFQSHYPQSAVRQNEQFNHDNMTQKH